MGNIIGVGSLNPKFIKKIQFSPSTVWLLSQCTEARGLQKMWQRLRPEALKSLQESALIQSVESSNRIEGVEVDKERLLPLVLGKSKAQTRPEEEIIGYKKALDYIYKNYTKLEVDARTIKHLHKLAQGGMTSDAGDWKTRNNNIIELNSKGEAFVRFRPVSAAKTPRAIENLCLEYKNALNVDSFPDLICVANFVLDFLCIHPFRDGNGRVSRLLTLLLLLQSRYEVGKYISLEKIIEDTKQDYYRVLKESSDGWHEKNYNLLPWWNYFLSTLRSAYGELKSGVEFTMQDTQTALVEEKILNQFGEFSISDIQKLLPSVDRELIKKTLAKMKANKIITPIGRGRGAKWKKY